MDSEKAKERDSSDREERKFDSKADSAPEKGPPPVDVKTREADDSD